MLPRMEWADAWIPVLTLLIGQGAAWLIAKGQRSSDAADRAAERKATREEADAQRVAEREEADAQRAFELERERTSREYEQRVASRTQAIEAFAVAIDVIAAMRTQVERFDALEGRMPDSLDSEDHARFNLTLYRLKLYTSDPELWQAVDRALDSVHSFNDALPRIDSGVMNVYASLDTLSTLVAVQAQAQ